MSELWRLGQSDVRVPPLAVGTWSWGDSKYWRFEPARDGEGVVEAFLASAQAGLWFDTAEVYGGGASERMLGWMAQRFQDQRVVVASKFGLLPGRTARTLPRALAATLRRLGREQLDLYQIHWPDRAQASIASLMDALADAVDEKRTRAVGVSNFTADEVREAHAALARRGVPLATCQVRFGLLDRSPEVNGVRAACDELGVTLLAYSPLAQGVLTGAWDEAHVPPGGRATEPWFSPQGMREAAPVLAVLREVAARAKVAMSTVALRWVIDRGAIPLAGARRGDHAAGHLAALQLQLEPADLAALDAASLPFLRA